MISKGNLLGRFPLDKKFRNFRNEDKWYGNFQEKVFEIWVYITRLSTFSEIMQIRNFLFSSSPFGCDHSELEISCKDDGDGDVYSKMEIL